MASRTKSATEPWGWSWPNIRVKPKGLKTKLSSHNFSQKPNERHLGYYFEWVYYPSVLSVACLLVSRVGWAPGIAPVPPLHDGCVRICRDPQSCEFPLHLLLPDLGLLWGSTELVLIWIEAVDTFWVRLEWWLKHGTRYTYIRPSHNANSLSVKFN
jgi:hypothetical protein